MSIKLERDASEIEDKGSIDNGFQTAEGDQNDASLKMEHDNDGQITLDVNRCIRTVVENQHEDATVICIEDIIKEIEDYVHINSDDENEAHTMTANQHHLDDMVSDQNVTQIPIVQNAVQVSLDGKTDIYTAVNGEYRIPTTTQIDNHVAQPPTVSTQNQDSIFTSNGGVSMNSNVELMQNISLNDQFNSMYINSSTDMAISPPYCKNNDIESEIQNIENISTDDVALSNKDIMSNIINHLPNSQKEAKKICIEYSERKASEKQNIAPISCANIEQEEIGLSTAEEIEIRNIIEMAERIYAENDNEKWDGENKYKNYRAMEENISNLCELEVRRVDSTVTTKLKTEGTNKPEHIKTEDYMLISNSSSENFLNEDEEHIIGLSADEELEIHAIIERAEQAYSKNEEEMFGDGKITNASKKAADDSKKMEKMDIDKSFINDKKTTGRGIVTYDDIELEEKINGDDKLVSYDETIQKYKDMEVPKNEKSWPKEEQLVWRGNEKPRKDQEHHDRNVKSNDNQNNKTVISTNLGNTKKDAISLEDKELIMELVSIAVGEKPIPANNSQEYSSLDKRGQIIKEFVKEYFEKCKAKSGECRRYNNYTYSAEYRDHQRIYSRSYGNKRSPESTDILRGVRQRVDMRNEDDRFQEKPHSTIRHHLHPSFCSPEIQRERVTEEMNSINLKWEFDGDKLVCKTTESEKDTRPDGNTQIDEEELKSKHERKRSFSLKGLPMNERGGNFFVDRTLVPVDLYQDGLLVHQWKPTSVLNEICAKCGWTLPVFTVVNCTEEGYLVSVNVNGQEFYPSFRGQTKRAARHLASAHFLKCIGFQCEEESAQHLSMNLNDRVRSEVKSSNRRRSVSLESIQIHEKDEESSRSKSRRCHILSQHRRISSESNERDITKEDRRKDKVDILWHKRDADHYHRMRSLSPPVHNLKGKYQTKQSPEENNKGRPPTWDKLDEIPPFVPRQRPTSARYPHSLLPTPRTPTPRKCRCKLSFPHPSIHPWRYEMKPQSKCMASVIRKV